MDKKMRTQIAVLLISAFLSLSIQAAPAEFKMLPTMNVVEEVTSLQSREELAEFIKTEKVQHELIRLGVEPKEALSRIASLSNSEVKSLSVQIKKAQAGGDFGVGSVLGIAVFIFIVLLITDILGLTKVFSFTRSIRA